MLLLNCYFIRTFIEILSNSLFISSRKTRNQILNIKLIVITKIIKMILIIIIMYFTTLEHLKAEIKGEELLLPRHTVMMCLWAKETLIWLSQKLELNRFHFHFCKLANNLTRFVNGRLRMRPIARAQEEYWFTMSRYVSSKRVLQYCIV